MKYTARIATLTALLCISSKAAPFMAVGDNAELFVTAAAAVQVDSNIYLDANNAKNDTVFSLTPGLDLVFGNGSATTGDVYYREEIRRYNTNTVQNTDLASVGFKGNYTNGVTKADFNGSYAELAQNDNIVKATGDLVHRKLTDVGGHVEFGISEKTSLSIGSQYEKTDYAPVTYIDSSILTFPVNVYYQASPNLDWSVGYQYRNTDLSGAAISSKDNYFSLGARGEFTPKLTGEVRFGYTDRSYDIGSNQSLLGVNANLAYAYSEKTTYAFNFSNDFGSSAFGDSTKNTVFGLTANNRFSEQWYVMAGVTYNQIKYPSRTDKFVQGQAAVTYVYNNILNFSASLTLRNNSSDVSAAEFSENVFSIGANVRY